MADRPLTENMERSLVALYRLMMGHGSKYPAPANTIAMVAGFRDGMDHGRSAHDGRKMAPAQRVITPLRHLERRGLVGYAPRPDGLSGGAYKLTAEGAQLGRVLSPTWPGRLG